MSSSAVVTASDWTKGISLSVLASMIGGASKLAIRKSWLLQEELDRMRIEGELDEAGDDNFEDGERQPRRDAVDANDAESILVTAVSTLSQEDDDEPLEHRPGNDAQAIDNGEDRVGGSELLVEMSSSHHQIRRHSMTSRAAAADDNAAIISSGSSASSLRQRLSLLVSRKPSSNSSANRSFDFGDPDSTGVSSSPYVRAPNSDPARRRSNEAAPFDSSLSARRLSFADGRPDPLSIPNFASRIENSNSNHSRSDAPLERDNDGPSRSDLMTVRRRRSSASSTNPRRGSAVSASQRGCCQSRFWICALRGSGMVGMTFLNPLCGVLAMNFASPSILAPFSGLTLVWIILFSEALIGERPTPMQVMAALMIVLGEVVVALYGDHTNDSDISAEEVRDSYGEPLFMVYFVVMALWMLLLVLWMRNGSATLRRFAWGVSGGSLTGLQNFLKDALTVTKATKAPAQNSESYLQDGEQSSHVLLVAIFIGMAVVAAFGGLILLTACMKRYDVTYSAAMFVGSFVLSASIMSVIHYDTFAHLHSVSSYVMYPTGLVILIGGVYMLVQESKECNDAEFEELVGIDPLPGSPASNASSSASSQSRGHGMIAMDSNLVRPRSSGSQRGQGFYA